MLNVKAPLNGLLGYGHAGINIVKALSFAGCELSLFPIGGPYLTTNDTILFQSLLDSRFDQFNIDNPSLSIWHEHLLFDALPSKKEVVGFPFFELDEFDIVRKKGCSCVDRLFATSEWGREVLRANGFGDKIPIDVVPLGVDTEIFYPKANTSHNYRFFSIGKIEERKCTRLLGDIFSAAFTANDNVEFHIMCDSPLDPIHHQVPSFKEMWKQSPLGDKITVHYLKNTDKEYADFIRSMDCGIFMTRAEGWGLPILQSLACGKPIIVTDYSAQTEFVNESNAHLVNITDREPAYDGVWFNGRNGSWATIGEAQIDQCVEYMRQCYKDNKRNNIEGINTANKFTWANTANSILRLLQ